MAQSQPNAGSLRPLIEKVNGQVLRLPIPIDGQGITVGGDGVYLSLRSGNQFLTIDDIARMYAEKTSTGIGTAHWDLHRKDIVWRNP